MDTKSLYVSVCVPVSMQVQLVMLSCRSLESVSQAHFQQLADQREWAAMWSGAHASAMTGWNSYLLSVTALLCPNCNLQKKKNCK